MYIQFQTRRRTRQRRSQRASRQSRSKSRRRSRDREHSSRRRWNYSSDSETEDRPSRSSNGYDQHYATSDTEEETPRARLLKNYRLPSFTGDLSDDLDVFLTHFNICAKSQDWNETDKLVNLRLARTGIAAALVNRYPDVSFRKFVRKLREHFGKENQAAACEGQLLQRLRRPGETIQQLRVAIHQLAAWAYPGEEGRPMFDAAAVTHLLKRSMTRFWLMKFGASGLRHWTTPPRSL